MTYAEELLAEGRAEGEAKGRMEKQVEVVEGLLRVGVSRRSSRPPPARTKPASRRSRRNWQAPVRSHGCAYAPPSSA